MATVAPLCPVHDICCCDTPKTHKISWQAAMHALEAVRQESMKALCEPSKCCLHHPRRHNRSTGSLSEVTSPDRHHAMVMQHVHDQCLQAEAQACPHRYSLSGHGVVGPNRDTTLTAACKQADMQDFKHICLPVQHYSEHPCPDSLI